MNYFRDNIEILEGYTPGFQPDADAVKLNTNENPYGCSPKVKAAIGRALQVGLQKYPDPMATDFRNRAGNCARAKLTDEHMRIAGRQGVQVDAHPS